MFLDYVTVDVLRLLLFAGTKQVVRDHERIAVRMVAEKELSADQM